MYIIVNKNCEPVPVRFHDEQCTFYKESNVYDILHVMLSCIGDHFKVLHIT